MSKIPRKVKHTIETLVAYWGTSEVGDFPPSSDDMNDLEAWLENLTVSGAEVNYSELLFGKEDE